MDECKKQYMVITGEERTHATTFKDVYSEWLRRNIRKEHTLAGILIPHARHHESEDARLICMLRNVSKKKRIKAQALSQ